MSHTNKQACIDRAHAIPSFPFPLTTIAWCFRRGARRKHCTFSPATDCWHTKAGEVIWVCSIILHKLLEASMWGQGDESSQPQQPSRPGVQVKESSGDHIVRPISVPISSRPGLVRRSFVLVRRRHDPTAQTLRPQRPPLCCVSCRHERRPPRSGRGCVGGHLEERNKY